MLICKFASPRSSPDKIATYIMYLQDVHQKHRNDAEALQVVENLLAEARSWTEHQRLRD